MPGLRARRKFRPGTRRSGVAALTAPVNTATPVVTPSSVSTGGTLTTTNGAWSGNPSPTFTYQWQKAGVNISAATTNSYVVQAGDVGSAITCNVTGTNSQGNATAASNGVTPTSGFAPTDITGLVAWFKADAGTSTTTDGAAISAWTEQVSGTNNAVQATGSKQPLYKAAIVNSKPVVRFDGVDDVLVTPSSLGLTAQPLTQVVVGLYRGVFSATNRPIISGAPAVSPFFCWLHRTNATDMTIYSGANVSATTTPQAAHVIVGIYNGPSSVVRVDGVAGTAGNPGTATHAQLEIGAGNTVGGSGVEFAGVDVCEVLVYNSALSGTNLTNLEAYLKARWGTP